MLLVRAARPCANTNEEKGWWKRIVSKRSWTTFLLVTNCIVWHAQKATSQSFSAWVRINVLEIVGMSQLQPQYACKCWQSWLHRFADKLLCQIGRKWGSCRWGYSVTTFKRNPNTQRRLAWRFSLSSFQATSLGRIFTSRSFAPDWGCQAWFELWLCPCIHLSARIWLMHTAADGFTVPINFMNTLIHCSFLGGRKTGTNKDAVGRVCSNTCN